MPRIKKPKYKPKKKKVVKQKRPIRQIPIRKETVMTEKEAALYVKLSPRTLQYFRQMGMPPTFIKFGERVRYTQRDLDKWIKLSKVRK